MVALAGQTNLGSHGEVLALAELHGGEPGRRPPAQEETAYYLQGLGTTVHRKPVQSSFFRPPPLNFGPSSATGCSRCFLDCLFGCRKRVSLPMSDALARGFSNVVVVMDVVKVLDSSRMYLLYKLFCLGFNLNIMLNWIQTTSSYIFTYFGKFLKKIG